MVKQELDLVFGALSDPTRRGLLAALAEGPRTVGELAAPLPISLVAVSKHLAVLLEAGLIRQVKVGRVRVCELTAEPLSDATAWLDRYRQFWTHHLDALARHLEEK